MVPEIECQTHATAVATAAPGSCGKNFAARPVPSPAFCTPTSIDMVRFFAVLNLKMMPRT